MLKHNLRQRLGKLWWAVPTLRDTSALRRLTFEPLEARQMLAAQPIISEFLANNNGGLTDAAERSSDEIGSTIYVAQALYRGCQAGG